MILGVVMIASIMSLASAQYTCPPFSIGSAVGGTSLGGANGYYQATSLDQCCYNCLVVLNSTCAAFTYYSQQGYCYLVSSIQFYQNNMDKSMKNRY